MQGNDQITHCVASGSIPPGGEVTGFVAEDRREGGPTAAVHGAGNRASGVFFSGYIETRPWFSVPQVNVLLSYHVASVLLRGFLC